MQVNTIEADTLFAFFDTAYFNVSEQRTSALPAIRIIVKETGVFRFTSRSSIKPRSVFFGEKKQCL